MRALFRFVRVANDYADADAGRGALARDQRAILGRLGSSARQVIHKARNHAIDWMP
jgi:hypothetical protein